MEKKSFEQGKRTRTIYETCELTLKKFPVEDLYAFLDGEQNIQVEKFLLFYFTKLKEHSKEVGSLLQTDGAEQRIFDKQEILNLEVIQDIMTLAEKNGGTLNMLSPETKAYLEKLVIADYKNVSIEVKEVYKNPVEEEIKDLSIGQRIWLGAKIAETIDDGKQEQTEILHKDIQNFERLLDEQEIQEGMRFFKELLTLSREERKRISNEMAIQIAEELLMLDILFC